MDGHVQLLLTYKAKKRNMCDSGYTTNSKSLPPYPKHFSPNSEVGRESRTKLFAGLCPFQQCFSHIMADMNNEKYIQVMISTLGLILISRHMCVPTIYKKTRFVKCTERSHLKYI